VAVNGNTVRQPIPDPGRHDRGTFVRHETRTWKVELFATGILFASALTASYGPISLSGLRPARTAIHAADVSAVSPIAVSNSLRTSGPTSLVVQHVIVPVNPAADPPPVRVPPWWSGPCDDNHYPGSFPLSTWDGLTACGPGPNRGGYDSAVEFFPGAWGELEWECVELSMRWLYLEYGVRPYAANGSDVVADYSPADGGDLQKISNDGTSLPRPGAVLSLGSDWGEGHTAVVTGVHVVHGNGTIGVLEENMNGGNGTNTLEVFKNVVEPDYTMPVTGWLQPPPVSAETAAAMAGYAALPAGDLVLDGGFNHQGPGAWHKTGRSRFRVELSPTLASKSAAAPYEGSGFAVTHAAASGGGIYQNIAFPVAAGESFCADAKVVSAGASAGARGELFLWLLGDTRTQSASARFGPLPNGNRWRNVSTCVTATDYHSVIRIQFYSSPHTGALGIDAVDVHQSFVRNGSFDHRSAAGWQATKHSWLAVETAGKLETMPYEGNGFAVTNSSSSSGSVYENVSLPIEAGDSLCADAEIVTAGAHSGARGKMAIWLLGKTKSQVSFVRFGRLAAKSRWSAISTCVTATGPHSSFRIQFFDAPRAPALGIDAVDVHQSFVANGGFNDHGSVGWHKAGRTWFGVEPAGKLHTSPYEGDDFGATATSVPGGGIYQDSSLGIRAGESFCADAEVVTAGARPGAEGEMSLTLLGRSGSQVSFVRFGPLPAKGQWSPVSTCVTSAGPHSGFRIRFYDAPNKPALGIDAVDVR
jgi:hypothetical protein